MYHSTFLYMTLYDSVWSCMITNDYRFYDFVWQHGPVLCYVTLWSSAWLYDTPLLLCMTMFDSIRLDLTLYDSTCPCMTLNDSFEISFNNVDPIWLCLARFDSWLILFNHLWPWLTMFNSVLTFFLLFDSIQQNLLENVQLCLNLFNSHSYAYILCLLF